MFVCLFNIYLAAPGLSCSMQDLAPQPRIILGPWHWEHGVLAMLDWTTREVPVLVFFDLDIFEVLQASDFVECTLLLICLFPHDETQHLHFWSTVQIYFILTC